MGFSTVEQAMSIVNSGSNFDITARDFQVKDMGQRYSFNKRETVKRATAIADTSVSTKLVQRD